MRTRFLFIVMGLILVSVTVSRAGVTDTLLFENFDNGAKGWEFNDLWNESHWNVSATGAYDGQSYWCGDEQLGGYDDHWKTTLLSPPISLQEAASPVLTFRHSYRVEPNEYVQWGFDAWDAMNVRISTDGINFSIISPTDGLLYNAEKAFSFFLPFGQGLPGWAGHSNGWEMSGVNLSAYAGQTIWIQFFFAADEGYSSSEDPSLFGWRIDDIRVMDGINELFKDDAGDTGEAKFMPGAVGGHNLWHITESASVSPPSSAGCFDTGSGSYKDGANAALVSPAFSLENIPMHTRELEMDFNVQGRVDHSYYEEIFLDRVFIEIRPYRDNKWDYWILWFNTEVMPEEFMKFKDFYHFDLDISNFMDADSLQVRVLLIACGDGQVIQPADLFIDDFLVVARTGYDGAQFGAFYDRISVASWLQRQDIADSFMATLPVCPLVEDEKFVTFLYQGDVDRITVPGLNFSWDTANCPMDRIPGTDLWFCQTQMAGDARQEYKFLVNGTSWINDPLNPDIVPFEFNNSRIAMPGYTEPEENDYRPGIPHGTYEDTLFASTVLGNSRTIRIYLPPGYESGLYERYPVILFHDGMSYYNDGNANNVIDYLIAENRIRPVIAVFVSPLQREDEYAFNLTDEFEMFIIDEVMPMIDAEYRTILEPEYRAMTGSSYGGLISTQICYNNPDAFGLCAPYSPGYFPKDMGVYFQVINGPKKDLKFYIDWGVYELGIMYYSMIFRDNLLYKGYEVEWHAWNDNHGMGNWRAHLDNMLEYFFPPVTSVNETAMANPFGLSAYPNPFSSTTTIDYTLPEKSDVCLAIFDSYGRQIDEFRFGKQAPGDHRLSWNASAMAQGQYFIRIDDGEQQSIVRVVVIR